MRHKPVLLREVLGCLDLKPGMTAVDGTLGSGGHSSEMLKAIGPTGRLIALDQDPASLERCRKRFEAEGSLGQVTFCHENFENLDHELERLNVSQVDAVLLDIGFSSDQLEDGTRGFSFERPGPLDMRMNPNMEVPAKDLINHCSEQQLADLFWNYGHERFSRKFAKVICEYRARKPLETTQELVSALESALPYKIRKPDPSAPGRGRGTKSKIHPATRVFQALRIAVNRELDVLREGLPRIWNCVKPGGRLAVISFHSSEDRIVKHQFQAWIKGGEGVGITKKPIEASREEEISNPRARSAKLRCVEKKR